jgi:hypothetical protein
VRIRFRSSPRSASMNVASTDHSTCALASAAVHPGCSPELLVADVGADTRRHPIR